MFSFSVISYLVQLPYLGKSQDTKMTNLAVSNILFSAFQISQHSSWLKTYAHFYPLKGLVDLIKLLCILWQLSANVTTDEDTLQIHPLTLNEHPYLHSTVNIICTCWLAWIQNN